MKALVMKKPGQAAIELVPEPAANQDALLLKVRIVGFCGSDLNTFRGKNPLVSYPRILGLEVSAAIAVALHELWGLRFLPPRPSECLSIQ
jgi:threonine dehydrogenase-like Zn-dependent dehydrogenase